MKPIVIIPARYGSTRFPGKPLVKIKGKTMIQRVYEQAKQVINDVWVATDDLRIESAVAKFGGKCVMTSSLHVSGTDRIAEAYNTIENNQQFSVVVNIQGDEPFIDPSQIQQLVDLCSDPKAEIATLIKKITSVDDLFNPNKPKVIRDLFNNAIYFSRSPIPFFRDLEKTQWHEHHSYYKHIGVYAYKSNILKEVTNLIPTQLEQAENLEQLRWIENNYTIKTGITEYENLSVDTEDDLNEILQKMQL
ncbi:MAG: 3-deoxy-manno-octulosonate cytidylyltransferase [Bacteroidales bacterium]